jgi:diacylglycerol O-acyltransferase / wax synthase
MQPLSGLDAFFLYIETPAMHTHVALAAVLDPSTMPGGYSFTRIRDHIASRVHQVPPFRRRAVDVPLRLHHPVWVDDPDFRIERHVKRAALPSPGGLHEFADLMGHVASTPLDRSRPLWEMWVVEGLEGGRIGLIAKVHHSAMDGASAADFMPAFFDLDRDAPTGEPPPWEPEPYPNDWELLGYAGAERLRTLGGLPALVRRTGGAITTIRRARQAPGEPSGGTPLTAPRAPFNGPLTADRSVAFARIPLDEVKHVRQALGGTVNDVLLATSALAVRRYLDALDALPDGPLVAACPVSVRADDERGQAGNRLSVLFTPLHSEMADPAAVYATTRGTAGAAKREHEVLGSSTLSAWAEVVDPSTSTLMSELYRRSRLSGVHPPALSLILSNIPGPPFPVYLAGAEMERAFPMGPIVEGAGLNVTVLSYRDHVDFGFMAATDLVPDVWALADAVGPAFADLLAVARDADGAAAHATAAAARPTVDPA